MSAEASTSSAPKVTGDDELEKLLSREASALNREMEVERILKAFKFKYVVKFYSLHSANSQIIEFQPI